MTPSFLLSVIVAFLGFIGIAFLIGLAFLVGLLIANIGGTFGDAG